MFIRRWRRRRHEARTGERLPRDWWGVGLDFVIVVVGVYLGIALGNWNDARAERAELAAFEDAFATERMRIYLNAKEVLATRRCRQEQIERLDASLREPGPDWRGQPWLGQTFDTSTLPVVMRAPVRNWTTEQLDTARTRSFFRRMDRNKDNLLSSWHNEARAAEAVQRGLRNRIAPINPLAVDRTLDGLERLEFERDLARLESDVTWMDIHAENLRASTEGEFDAFQRGFEGRTLSDHVGFGPDDLESRNSGIFDTYGDCADPIIIPADILGKDSPSAELSESAED